MNRKEFLTQVGSGAAILFLAQCVGGLSSCKKSSTTADGPSNVDFTLDVSKGALATKGSYLVQNGIIVAHTKAGEFIAVAAACTHEGTTIQYSATNDNFHCANHGATFNDSGVVTKGPASSNLKQYNTSLTGNSLHVFS
jgi:cytochrome b6-f complex iron-sulfur subunit